MRSIKNTIIAVSILFFGLFVFHEGQSLDGHRSIASVQNTGMAQLEAIISQASGLEDFLGNERLKSEYLQALKNYYGEVSGLDTYFESRLRDLEELSQSNPGLREQAWELLDWESRSFTVTSSINNTGIALEEGAFNSHYLPQLELELKQLARSSLEEIGEHQAFSEQQIINENILDRTIREVSEEVESLSSLPKKQRGLAMKNLKESPRVKLVQSFFAYHYLQLPNVRAMLTSQDADIVLHALNQLTKVSNYGPTVLSELEMPLAQEVRELPGAFNISQNSQIQTTGEIQSLFEKARQGKREFELIPSAGTDDELIRQSNQQKTQLVENLNQENPLFKLKTIKQSHNNKIILRPTGSKSNDLNIVSLPRRIHGIFSPVRHNECVKDRCAKWGVSLIRSSQVYFTETSSGKMTGYMQILPGTDETGRIFGALEVMTPSGSGDIINLDQEGMRLVKTARFDAILDQLYQNIPENWNGIIISDGSGSNNAGGKNAVYMATSYILGEDIGVRPGDLSLILDDVSNNLPQSSNGYSSQKFIGDGINRDGNELRLLLPSDLRKELTYSEFVSTYMIRIAKGQDLKSLNTLAEHLSYEPPSSEKISQWRSFQNIPFEQMSQEQIEQFFSVEGITGKVFRDESNHPWNNRFVTEALNNETVFSKIVDDIHKKSNKDALQVLLSDSEYRERILERGARTFLAKALTGADRTQERNLFSVYSQYVNIERLLDHQDTKTVFYDWYFQADQKSISNFKKRNSYRYVSPFFTQQQLTEEFLTRIQSNDTDIQRNAIISFSQSDKIENIVEADLPRIRSAVGTPAFTQFIKDEIQNSASSSLLLEVQRKMDNMGLREDFMRIASEGAFNFFNESDLSLESPKASTLVNNEFFKQNPDLQVVAKERFFQDGLYQRFLNQSNQNVPVTANTRDWARLILSTPSDSVTDNQKLATILTQEYSALNSLNPWRDAGNIEFGNIIKSIAQEKSGFEIYQHRPFINAYLNKLVEISSSTYGPEGSERHLIQMSTALLTNNSVLREEALQSTQKSQKVMVELLKLYTAHNLEASRGQAVESILAEMRHYLFDNEGNLRPFTSQMEIERYIPIRLLSTLDQSQAQKLIDADFFIRQIDRFPQLVINEISNLAGNNGSAFKSTVENTRFQAHLQMASVNILFETENPHTRYLLFSKPLSDILDIDRLAEDTFERVLRDAPDKTISTLSLFNSKSISAEVTERLYTHPALIDAIISDRANFSYSNLDDIIKNMPTEKLGDAYQAPQLRQMIAHNIAKMQELTKSNRINSIAPLFEYQDFQRELAISMQHSDQAFASNGKVLLKSHILPLIDREVFIDEFRGATFSNILARSLFADNDETRRFSYQLISHFPEIVEPDSPVMRELISRLTSEQARVRQGAVNVLKSKAGEALLNSPHLGEELIETVQSSNLSGTDKERIFRAISQQVGSNASCFGLVNSLL